MDAYIQAHITGWCSFQLDSMDMMFYEGDKRYVFPVTWMFQKSSLLPRCMKFSTDTLFYVKLEKISVNGKDASGCLKHFTDASIDSIKVTVRGIGRKDLKITGMSLYDGRHRHLNLPEKQMRPFQVVYKTYKTMNKLSGSIPKAIKDIHGNIGLYVRRNTRTKTARYQFNNGDVKELFIKNLKGSGCGRKCLIS